MKAKALALPVIWYVVFAYVILMPTVMAFLSLRDGQWGHALLFTVVALFWTGSLVLFVYVQDE